MDNQQWLKKASEIISDCYVMENIRPLFHFDCEDHIKILVHDDRTIMLAVELQDDSHKSFINRTANLEDLESLDQFNSNPLNIILTRYPLQNVRFDIRCIGELDTAEATQELERLIQLLIRQTHFRKRKTGRWNKKRR